MKKKFRNIVVLTSLTTLTIHMINKTVSFLSTIKDLLRTGTGNFYEWRFGKIYYTKQGTGTPLLLIHDLSPDSSSYEWSQLIETLSKNHTVYALDLLGCGRSDKPNLTYTNFLYVQLITDFIKNVISHKTDVLVSGSSSSIALMTCQNENNLLNKIIMINPDNLYKLNEIPSKRTKLLKLFIETPIIGTLIYYMLVCKMNIENNFIENNYFNPFKVHDKHIHTYYESAHLLNGRGKYLFASLKGRYTNTNILHALKTINNSIFIIGGSDEPNIDNTIDNYCYYNPAIESSIIHKTKHLPQFENPSALLEQINIYL